jgi:hypothetical protein
MLVLMTLSLFFFFFWFLFDTNHPMPKARSQDNALGFASLMINAIIKILRQTRLAMVPHYVRLCCRPLSST